MIIATLKNIKFSSRFLIILKFVLLGAKLSPLDQDMLYEEYLGKEMEMYFFMSWWWYFKPITF